MFSQHQTIVSSTKQFQNEIRAPERTILEMKLVLHYKFTTKTLQYHSKIIKNITTIDKNK